MEILKVEHIDFELSVICNNFEKTFYKAKVKQSKITESTSYSVNDGNIYLVDLDTRELNKLTNDKTFPVFFENKDYFISFTFKEIIKINNPFIYSKLKGIGEKFFYPKNSNNLSGTVNFGNDLGKSDLILRYSTGNKSKEFVFNFEVFPTKLDFRSDHDKIIADIQKEYPHLVLDFLKKTYSSFRSGSSQNSDLIWWQVFGQLYSDFISASHFILSRPHSRIVKQSRYSKADRIVSWNKRLEEEVTQFRNFPDKKYKNEYRTLSVDTPENRFFKHSVFQTFRRYKKIKEFIFSCYEKEISNEFKDELNSIEREMEIISHNPFFKTIDIYSGLRQESLVLQKATGYSTIYKCWVMLNSGIKFLEGIQKLELKNIADLYQIWCFLEMKKVLQKLLNKEKPDDVDIAVIQIDDFVFKIERGVNSQVTFKQNNGDQIELYHDFSYSKTNDKNVRSFTVNQRPDIVLKITKNDILENYDLTYLYDAKYRLASDEDENAPDIPPEDAINQMHRYRDALYYVNKEKERNRKNEFGHSIKGALEKEIIGAYVLFPGAGQIDYIRNADYYKSISEVNIGAFPLRPNDTINRNLLEEHIKKILQLDTESILKDVAPQKFMSYEDPDAIVFAGFTSGLKQRKYFKTDYASTYHMPMFRKSGLVNVIRNISKLKYFAPIVEDGIEVFFEIDRVLIMPRNEIYPKGHDLYKGIKDSYYVFMLRNKKKLTNKVKSEVGGNRMFRYAKISELKSCESINEFNKIKQDQ
jgi:hypothetical protein